MPIAPLRTLPVQRTSLRELNLNMLLGAPVLALPMQEGAGNFIDISGYGNDGVPTDVTRLVLPSGLRVGSFNGISSVVNCGVGPSLNLVNNFTMMAWLNCAPQDSIPLAWGENGVGKRRSIYIEGSGDFWFSGYAANVSSGLVIADSTWHLGTITVSPVNLVSTYVDEVAGATGIPALVAYIFGGTFLGANPGLGERYIGLIALPRVFDRVLSILEIQNTVRREKHLFGLFDGNILARLLKQRELAVVR